MVFVKKQPETPPAQPVTVLNLTANPDVNGDVFTQLTVRTIWENGVLKGLDFGGRNTAHHVVQDGATHHVITKRLEPSK